MLAFESLCSGMILYSIVAPSHRMKYDFWRFSF